MYEDGTRQPHMELAFGRNLSHSGFCDRFFLSSCRFGSSTQNEEFKFFFLVTAVFFLVFRLCQHVHVHIHQRRLTFHTQTLLSTTDVSRSFLKIFFFSRLLCLCLSATTSGPRSLPTHTSRTTVTQPVPIAHTLSYLHCVLRGANGPRSE